MNSTPYIILLGDVGSGKSTLVEKLSGATGRSSAASTSETVTSEVFESYDGTLIICDTPGSNSMSDQFEHNLHIAHAMNFRPVSCVLIVVKAETRLDSVVKNVRGYAEGFVPEDLPIELIGVCVTHMDTVSWTENDLLPYLKRDLEIETAVFCSLDTPKEVLKQNLLSECETRPQVPLNVDGEVFFTLFRINSSDTKVLRDARREVRQFEKMIEDYYQHKDKHSEADQLKMTFEFHKIMLEEIIEAQKRLSNNNNFTFIDGPAMASEAGHIANMTNQLHNVLSGVKNEALKLHEGVDPIFRKFPYCSAVTEKIEGCEGEFTCGNQPLTAGRSISEGCFEMSTFKFVWDSTCEKLTISKLTTADSIDCGNSIEWSQMAPFKPPGDFDVNPKSSEDVSPTQRSIVCFPLRESFSSVKAWLCKRRGSVETYEGGSGQDRSFSEAPENLHASSQQAYGEIDDPSEIEKKNSTTAEKNFDPSSDSSGEAESRRWLCLFCCMGKP